MVSFIKFTKYSPQAVSPNVRHLELVDFDWDIDLDGVCPQRALLPNFASTLTHFYLRDGIFRTFLDVLDAICTFSCLQSLSLENVKWGKNDSPGPTPRTRSIARSLTHLRVRNIDLRQFISWVLAHQEIPIVSSLDIGPIEEYYATPVGQYLCILGSSLIHLGCVFGPGMIGYLCLPAPDDFPIPIPDYHKSIVARFKDIFCIDPCRSIRPLINLRSIRIDNFICSDGVGEGASSCWGPRVLVSFQSLELKAVVLAVSLSRVGDLDRRDIKWDFFDEVFTSASFANVTSITFSVSGRVNLDGLAGYIHSRLPRCAELGLLQFVKEDPVKAAISYSISLLSNLPAGAHRTVVSNAGANLEPPATNSIRWLCDGFKH